MTAEISKFIDTAVASYEAGTLKNLVFSGFSDKEISKIRGELRLIGGECVMQFEYFLSEGRLKHENVKRDELRAYLGDMCGREFKRADLNDAKGAASLMISKKGKITFICDAKLKNREAGEAISDIILGGNDRQKSRMLTGDEEFLKALGVSDKDGRVHDKRQPKFRQICRFAENVRDIVKYLPEEGTLHIADLCCGKSYLSFAVYYCFTAIFGRQVEMTCIDLKKSVIDECAAMAEKLGYTGMHFICADISTYEPTAKPDLVVSLHACDTATDIVLDFAAKWRSDVILSTPCCHHELNRILSCPELDFIAENSILKQKFCDAATDSLRIMRLKASGYNAVAIELIDPEETPKNVLIRAIRKKGFDLLSKQAALLFADYSRAYRYLTGTEPKPLDVIK